MILVRRDATDLVEGYKLLEQFLNELSEEWAPRLNRQYIKQRERYQLLRRQRAQFSWWERLLRPKPSPPKNPLRPTLYDQVYWPLWQEWLRRLSSSIQVEIAQANYQGDNPESGKAGELRVMQFFSRLLDDRYFGLFSLRMNTVKEGDIDFAIIGPKGIWLFEVKNWHGHVRGPAWGNWEQTKPDGTVVNPHSPRWYWSKVCEDVGTVLRQRNIWSDPFALRTWLHIQGGVVFTVGETTLDIAPVRDRDKQVSCGKLTFWEQQFKAAASLPENSSQLTFKILDGLLTQHQWVTNSPPSRSMQEEAAELIDQIRGELALRTHQSNY